MTNRSSYKASSSIFSTDPFTKTNDGIEVIMPVEHPDLPIVRIPTHRSSHSLTQRKKNSERRNRTEARRRTSSSDEQDNSLISMNRRLKEELEDLRRRYERVRSANERLEKESKGRVCEGRCERARELEARNKELMHEIETLRAENKRLASHSKKSTYSSEGVEELKQRIKELEESHRNELNSKSSEWETRQHATQEELDRLKEELDKVRSEAGSSSWESRYHTLHEELEELRKEFDKMSKSYEKLKSEHETSKHSSSSTGDLRTQIDTLTQTVEQQRIRIQELESRKESSNDTEMDLMNQTDRITNALTAKELLVEELRRDKMNLLTQIENSRSKLTESENNVQKYRSESSQWEQQKTTMMRELERIKAEVIRMKKDNAEREKKVREETERITREKALRDEEERERKEREAEREKEEREEEEEKRESSRLSVQRVQRVPDRVRYVTGTDNGLQNLIREQESHIRDLQREVESLRLTISDYQQEIDKLRATCGMATDRNDASTRYDLAAAHRRLLEENAKVLSILERYPKQAATTTTRSINKGRMSTSLRGVSPVSKITGDLSNGFSSSVENISPEVQERLAQAQSKLKTSSKRVKQLEQWLDEIYEGQDSPPIPRTGSWPRHQRGTAPQRGITAGEGVVNLRFQFDDSLGPVMPGQRGVNYRAMQENRRTLAERKRNGLI